MKIVIPISEQQNVHDSFISGIESQTIKCEIIFVKNPITFNEKNNSHGFYIDRETFRKRSILIADSRNLCLPKLCEDEVSIMQDSSLIHQNKNNIKDMFDLLMSDEKIVAVALAKSVRHWFPLEYNHINNGCVIARRSIWQNVKFEVPENEQCTCLSFNRQVRKFGIYRFLDLDNKRVLIKKFK